jgi:hypothetical protein
MYKTNVSIDEIKFLYSYKNRPSYAIFNIY